MKANLTAKGSFNTKFGSSRRLGSVSARSFYSDQDASGDTSARFSQGLHPDIDLSALGYTRPKTRSINGDVDHVSSSETGGGTDDDEHEYVEVTLDVHDDGIHVHSVTPALNDDSESRLLAAHAWQGQPAFVKGRSLGRNASARIKAFSQELKAYSHDLKNELKRFSLNNAAAATTCLTSAADVDDHDHNINTHVSIPMRPRQLDRTKSAAHEALKRLRFITESTANDANLDTLWKAVETRFYELASPEGLLARGDFGPCIGMKDSKEFASELFDTLARKRGQQPKSITREELHDYWLELIDQSFDNRLQLFFEMVDRNADGRVTEDEVKELIRLSASANKLSRLKDQAEEYATLIMEELDPDHIGYIEIWQLETLFLQGPSEQGYTNYSSALSYSQALSQNLMPQPRRSMIGRCVRKAHNYVFESWKRIWVMVLWIGMMAGLFTWKFIQYKQREGPFEVMGYCVCTAKGAAETLKLNMALILLPVCRNTITWLRNTRLGSIIPFDDNLNFHKTIACGVAIGVIVHGVVHLTCDFPRIISASDEKWDLIASDFKYKRPNYGFFLVSVEGVTGIIMVVLMVVAFTLATRWFRRNLVKSHLPKPLQRLAGFNAFWFSHHLFIFVYICLFIHGACLFLTHTWYKKTTWMYLSIPILIYVFERLLRFFRSSTDGVKILKVAVYPGNVLTLHMSKPPGFKHKSGQYVFIKCPKISPFEWHPFSITSAPADDYVSVHIRTSGDWTQALKTIFSEVCERPMSGKSGLLRRDCVSGGEDKKMPRILLDGPYGAPAQDYKKYDVMLLVGLGIGATPFVSILKDMLNTLRHSDQQQQQDLDMAEGAKQRKKDSSGATRAYFYWVTREQGSFDWFKGIMNEVAECDQKGVIELHNYLTSVYEEGDARSALITMLQALNQAKNGVDILSGTRVRTHLGRPKWRKVFSKMATNHKGERIGVFYCGAPMLANELRSLSQDYNNKYSHTYGTRFDFHKENF
ncbi:hypothetical protein GOP47_0001442 [Adiantum capillus-veneris]|uniref:Uncharacterized protein n=1 Tax=Adiantum capillus-veneris TaxID=13818 RepID=A0A9D4ZN87_ADICA|nr:hypothetical protein GOP47_0001442 [Adiantum capillus-veneris]